MVEVGRPLREGDVVMSGALGPMVVVAPGDSIVTTIAGLGSVTTCCCSVQAALGCAVTFTCLRRRLPCSMTTNTYSSRNVAVTATKKSHARMLFAWFFRKVDQR